MIQLCSVSPLHIVKPNSNLSNIISLRTSMGCCSMKTNLRCLYMKPYIHEQAHMGPLKIKYYQMSPPPPPTLHPPFFQQWGSVELVGFADLRLYLRALGQLGEGSNWSPTQISTWETGISPPPSSDFHRFNFHLHNTVQQGDGSPGLNGRRKRLF